MPTIFVLTHWGRDQIAVIFLTTFSNAFFLTKMYQCQLKFHWSSFLKARLTKFQHWFRKWLSADQTTSHYLNQWWFDYRRIYASLGLNKLISILVANSLYLTWLVHNVSFICHPYDWHLSHANFLLIALSVCSAISSHFINTQKSILNAWSP